jgi:hypothetical protein
VHYGFTNKGIESLIPATKYWQYPPVISNVVGGISAGFSQEEKAFIFEKAGTDKLSFALNASEESPLVNPVFVIQNCGWENIEVKINGESISKGKELRIGKEYNTEGKPKIIVWLKINSIGRNNVELNSM